MSDSLGEIILRTILKRGFTSKINVVEVYYIHRIFVYLMGTRGIFFYT